MELVNGTRQLDLAAASSTVRGQSESGDLYAVERTASGALLAVVDGLGHGAEAAEAARRAIASIRKHAGDALPALLRKCHEELKATRGVALSVANIDTHEDLLTWLAVGNVAGVVVRGSRTAGTHDEHLLVRGGVVGYRLPSLDASVVRLAGGDAIIMATDGILEGFERGFDASSPAEASAAGIHRRYGRSDDDALVLVARYRGGEVS